MKVPKQATEQFKQISNTVVRYSFLNVPDEECQGGGINRQNGKCAECKEKFCNDCLVKDL